jgi:hypothetical protein
MKRSLSEAQLVRHEFTAPISLPFFSNLKLILLEPESTKHSLLPIAAVGYIASDNPGNLFSACEIKSLKKKCTHLYRQVCLFVYPIQKLVTAEWIFIKSVAATSC